MLARALDIQWVCLGVSVPKSVRKLNISTDAYGLVCFKHMIFVSQGSELDERKGWPPH